MVWISRLLNYTFTESHFSGFTGAVSDIIFVPETAVTLIPVVNISDTTYTQCFSICERSHTTLPCLSFTYLTSDSTCNLYTDYGDDTSHVSVLEATYTLLLSNTGK